MAYLDNCGGSTWGTFNVDMAPEKTKKIAELEERVTRQARELDDLREQNRAATLRLAGDTRKFAALREVMETIYE